MGSEQSQHQNASNTINRQASTVTQPLRTNPPKLQRGHTIATTGRTGRLPQQQQSQHQDDTTPTSDSRPVSPPMSVCSDSDIPYISYTDKPIGDSPKLRNKGANSVVRNVRPASVGSKKQLSIRSRAPPAHNIVVVKTAVKAPSLENDVDIIRIQSIPTFLPVMRTTLSLPANRDPEVLEKLEPIYLQHMCRRMQDHLNVSANLVAGDQALLTAKVKEIDQKIYTISTSLTDQQKLFASYADQFSKVRQISQQLSRCNTILNQNIEYMEQLNNMLDVEDRLEPFVWKTN